MSDTTFPTQTPNKSPFGLFDNPVVRKWLNLILPAAVLLVLVAQLVDQSIPQIDYAVYTDPAFKIVAGIAALFGVSVTLPNVPGGFAADKSLH